MDTFKSGAFIKQKRAEKKLTQKELAELLNCTDKAVSRWETGKGFPEVSFLIPLSDALDVSVNEIILGEDIEMDNLIKKSNEVIVETIENSIKKINQVNLILYILIIFIEAFVFYIPSLTAKDGDEMAIALLNIIGVAVCSVFIGFLKNIKLSYKFVFIPVTVLLFIPSTCIFMGPANFYDYALPYSAIMAIMAFVLIVICSGITKAVSKIVQIIKSHI